MIFKYKIRNSKKLNFIIVGFLSLNLFAQNATEIKTENKNKYPARESHKDLIQKARNLSLQRDRLQVSKILTAGMKEYKQDSPAWLEIQKNLEQLTSMFYTDKAMQAYELAKSAAADKPKDAMDHLQEANKLEPQNIKVLSLMGRLYLQESKCEKALSTAEQALLSNEYFKDSIILKFQSLACLNESEKFYAFDVANSYKWKLKNPYFLHSLALVQIQNKLWQEAEQSILSLEQVAKDFADLYLLKTQDISNKKLLANYIQYSNWCKDSVALRKKYELEPRLCMQLDEVQKNIKTLENQELNENEN